MDENLQVRTSCAGEKMGNKGGKHFKNCMIRNKKIQTFVTIYVMKEDLHTYEETACLPCVKPAKL